MNLIRSFSDSKEKVIASKSTKGVKRQIPVMDQLKRGSQKISVKNMVYLLLVTNVILVGLLINKKRKNDQHISEECICLLLNLAKMTISMDFQTNEGSNSPYDINGNENGNT